ncbi:HDA1 [[Candida] subhashii]|uniref:Histone deacetylase HDA1 n=1 Tax=[Candida] subhashii TaxID=561895 RepID=A0A8J5QIX8_9ASCO|nr:HDA1 [[Candida] subhashii]KAG7662814.1 HDA1 [[Candida] subhashii]
MSEEDSFIDTTINLPDNKTPYENNNNNQQKQVDDNTEPAQPELTEQEKTMQVIEPDKEEEEELATDNINPQEQVTNGNAADDEEPPAKRIKLEEQEVEAPAEPEPETIISNGNNIRENKIVVVPHTKPHLFYVPLKTGLVYDVRMRYHAKIFTSYFEYIDPHPEDPRRIYRIYKKLAEAGLIQDQSLSGIEDIGPLMHKIPIREATIEEILQVHSEQHLKYIQSTETMSRDQLMEETEKGDSIYVNNDSYFSAKLSCGGTIEACKAVIEGRVKNSLAVVRPPGHHAEPETPGGFCLFSNVAVAAKNILKSYPESVRKIVIVDWDIHHGNGTQKSFYDDPRVLYISLHRYENGRFYPGTKYGNSDHVGEGPGEGYSLNIPWRSAGMHDGDYVYAFNRVVIPTIMEFDPDLVIISSGFDAADGDIIGGCHVTPAGYGYMTHMLKGIAKGKLAVILEGGYNLDSISNSALAVAKVLVGEPPENTISSQPHPETVEVLDEVVKIQSKYWKCLRHGIPTVAFDDVYDMKSNGTSMAYKLVNIADPIRAHQSNELFSKYSFINIPIIANNPTVDDNKSGPFTTDLPGQLEDIIIASPDVFNSTTIILSIHDPPDIWANINPVNGTIETNSSIILEHPVVQIINKIKQEQEKESDSTPSASTSDSIGYIDINIPSYQLPIPGLTTSNTPASTYNPIIFAQEILLYIWDNYISYSNSIKKIIMLGFGDAYQAIVNLFSKRPSSEIKELVKGTIAFVNRTSLKPLVPVMDESMVDWYYTNSVIFTSCYNPCWTGSNGVGRLAYSSMTSTSGGGENNSTPGDEGNKRPRRKFGRVIKASVDGIWDIMHERFDEGVDFILDSIEDCSSSESGVNN